MTTPDHRLSDSRAPRDGDPECDNCLEPYSAHLFEPGGEVWCSMDDLVNDGTTFTPMTEQSEREMRASMRGEA